MLLRNVLIRLGGHDPKTVDKTEECHGCEVTQPVTMAGSTILLAGVVTAVNWAIAGHSLGGGDASAKAIVAAMVGCALGFLLVAVIDRAGIYQMDTHTGHPAKKGALLLIRAAVVLLVSSVTTQAIAPRLLEPELKARALQMREQADAERGRELAQRFSLDKLTAGAKAADKAVAEAREAVATIPPDIRVQQEKAQACWKDYGRRKAWLLRQGYEEDEARRYLSRRAAECVAAQTAAQRALEAYGAQSRDALASEEQHQRAVRATLEKSEAEVNGRIKEAEDLEKDVITPQSATVLASLLASDRGAWLKWYGIYALITCLELLPLLLKVFGGPSVPGVHIAAQHEIAVASERARFDGAREGQARAKAIQAAMDDAMTEALGSPSVRDQMMRHFRSKLEALMPIETAARIIEEIEAGATATHAAERRHPSEAQIIAEVWTQAMAEVSELLKPVRPPFGGAPTSPPPKGSAPDAEPETWREPEDRMAA